MSRNFLNKVIHGGKVKSIRERGNPDILDFSANLNPAPPKLNFFPDPKNLSYYPDDSYYALKLAISKIFRRKPEEITVGNGSIEIIRVFCASFLKPGDIVHIQEPTFGEYAYSAGLYGAEIGDSKSRAKASFFCNPNNPTGELVTKEYLEGYLRDCAESDSILFLDEAFIELSDPSQSMVANCDPSLFVLRSLTKSFSVPGIRFGYGFGDCDLIEKMEAVRPPWTVNTFAEEFALEAFRHYQDLEASRRYIHKEREWLMNKFSDFPVRIYPSSTNFILLDFGEDITDLCAGLEREGILVRDCHSFGLPTCIRVAVRTRDENRRLIEAFIRCVH